MYNIFFIYPSVDGHLGCFHVLAIEYSATVKWPSSKSLQTVNSGEGVEKREPYYTVGGM